MACLNWRFPAVGVYFVLSNTFVRIFHLGFLVVLDGVVEPSTSHGTVEEDALALARAAGL